jgi:hypothetical protein
VHRAVVQSPGTGLGLPELHGEGGPGPDLGVAGHGMPSGVWCTINNQLRTGTDKGNLTV